MSRAEGRPESAQMLQFSCPHCDQILCVPEAHLGKRGRCNKCGGRIALIGRAGATGIQAASAVADGLEAGNDGQDSVQPATEKQLEFLRSLGAPAHMLNGLDRERASTLIDCMKNQRLAAEPPTEKQLAYITRLGASEGQLRRVRSKAEASALIEDLHLSPTAEQMERLHQLGATGAQLAVLKHKAGANALIEALSK